MGKASNSLDVLADLMPRASVSLSVTWAQGLLWLFGHHSGSRAGLQLPSPAPLWGLTPSHEGASSRRGGLARLKNQPPLPYSTPIRVP